MDVQDSADSRSFAKETRALKMKNIVASHWKLTRTNWKPSWKLILVQLYEKMPRNSTSTVLWSLGIWSKLKWWKSSIYGCLMSWPQIKKKLSFWSIIISHSVQQQWTISQSDCDSEFYTTTTDNHLSSWMEKKLQGSPQSQNCTKKGVTVTVGWSDPLQLSESRWNHYIWEVYSANRCDVLKTARPVMGNGPQKGPNSSPRQRPMLQKLNELGYKVLPYSPDLSPTNHHFFKHLNNFLQGQHFHNQQDAENASQERVESWSTDFYATRINKLIACWQKCVDCNGSYFD